MRSGALTDAEFWEQRRAKRYAAVQHQGFLSRPAEPEPEEAAPAPAAGPSRGGGGGGAKGGGGGGSSGMVKVTLTRALIQKISRDLPPRRTVPHLRQPSAR